MPAEKKAAWSRRQEKKEKVAPIRHVQAETESEDFAGG